MAASVARARRLPPELTDMIIHLAGYDSFFACALVCRSWVAASRQYFPDPTISFGSTRDLERATQFCRLLESPHVAMKNFERIYIRDVEDEDVDLLRRIISHLHNIGELTIQGEWGSIASQAFVGSPMASTVIELFVTYGAYFESHTSFLELLGTFSSVQRLDIDGDITCSASPDNSYPPCCLTNLNYLYIYSPQVAEFLPMWLVRAKDLSTLSEVDLGRAGLMSWDPINQLLKHVGEALSRLTICAHDPEWPEDNDFSPGIIDLSHNSALQSLTLRLYVATVWEEYDGDPAGKVDRVCLPRVISMMSSSSLMNLNIEISDGTRKYGHAMDEDCIYDLLVTNGVKWAELDNVLTAPRFDSLRKVRIYYGGESNLASVDTAIRQSMSHTVDRGILRFHGGNEFFV
ncbi:hypothetical protein PLICRDRAFT_55126 [Plicaturopsis crispa FD-325 SS-3]|nr:hypothetical protein PLICRDRAFT_55126 [Plicaturopsis crispa FD-325 SS-3]